MESADITLHTRPPQDIPRITLAHSKGMSKDKEGRKEGLFTVRDFNIILWGEHIKTLPRSDVPQSQVSWELQLPIYHYYFYLLRVF